MVHFSAKPKNEPHSPSRELSERENQQFKFYEWFQKFFRNFIKKRQFKNFVLPLF
ncbi:MAG: hypothetical protein U5L45_18715 [Saprospiraceae bacterium]|nr:hypothetical protein [Saprospiraceae bacterium]